MPRRLLRDAHVVSDDWQYLDELPDLRSGSSDIDTRPVIVPFERWINERDVWSARRGRLGICMGPAHKVELLAADLPRIALIAADIANPSEGRGYSQARLLRERWRFPGELRARGGGVRQDQVFFLARCGFNSFELPDAELEAAAAALRTFSAEYQVSNDRGLPVRLRRRHEHPQSGESTAG
jgi:uncharacterized protein (DUF934 family)